MSPLAFYKCLADDTRLKTLLLLVNHTELCVCEFTDALKLSQPKISRHLADLRKCKLVIGERRGKWVYYQLHPDLPVWSRQALQLTFDNNPDYLSESQRNLAQASCATCDQ